MKTFAFRRALLSLALASGIVHGQDNRAAIAQLRLDLKAAVAPGEVVTAGAFFREVVSIDSIKPRLADGGWEGIEVLGLRHRTGVYLIEEGSPGETDAEKLRRFDKALVKYKQFLEENNKGGIVGLLIKGRADRLLTLAPKENVMVELSPPGYFGPVPDLDNPSPGTN